MSSEGFAYNKTSTPGTPALKTCEKDSFSATLFIALLIYSNKGLNNSVSLVVIAVCASL